MSKHRILGDVVFDGDIEALASKLRAEGFDCVMTYVYDYDLPEEFESSQVMSVWKDVDPIGGGRRGRHELWECRRCDRRCQRARLQNRSSAIGFCARTWQAVAG